MYYVYISVYTLLKVVSNFHLSVQSMSVMGFQKKLDGGWVGGWGELYPVLFWIFGICLTLQSPLPSFSSDMTVWHSASNVKNSCT